MKRDLDDSNHCFLFLVILQLSIISFIITVLDNNTRVAFFLAILEICSSALETAKVRDENVTQVLNLDCRVLLEIVYLYFTVQLQPIFNLLYAFIFHFVGDTWSMEIAADSILSAVCIFLDTDPIMSSNRFDGRFVNKCLHKSSSCNT